MVDTLSTSPITIVYGELTADGGVEGDEINLRIMQVMDKLGNLKLMDTRRMALQMVAQSVHQNDPAV